MKLDGLFDKVIGCVVEVHRLLGAGLLASTYEYCVAHGLKQKGIAFRLQ